MRSTIALCILSSCILIGKAQLNYEGSPLTENTDYKAEETQYSRSNTNQDIQRFEVSEGRTLSKNRFVPSSIDPLQTDEYVSSSSEATRQKEESGLISNDNSPISANQNIRHENPPEIFDYLEAPAIEEDFPKVSSANFQLKSESETPLSKVPIESRETIDLPSLSEALEQSRNFASSYFPTDQSSTDYLVSQSQGSMIQRDQALNQFLNSRTPQESEVALQNYLAMREKNSQGPNQQSLGLTNDQMDRRTDQQMNRDSNVLANQDSARHIDTVRASVPDLSSMTSPNDLSQIASYPSPYQQQLQHYPPRWHPNGLPSRRDGLWPGNVMRRPIYRGPMRPRGNPWLQSRLSPGPMAYPPKGPIYGRPPPGPAPGPWKQPVEVIYTKPPGFGKSPPSNPPIPYEDASKWFPESNEPPVNQKDIYYSQLYAQSYDPHYYNYIAKTGKIKPWLYGKLGKDQESKSIWWELFSGFKKHGMKNMTHPMFLLGMSIPTLTLMLSALVQKRSAGRKARSIDTDIGILTPEEWIEKYQEEIAEQILAYEQQVQDRLDEEKNERMPTKRRNRRR